MLAADRVKEIAEPVAYDYRDLVVTTAAEDQPLAKIENSFKNELVELYLGISVILVGLGGGQLSGAFALQSLLEAIFDRYVEFGLIFILPTYVLLNFRKNAGLDDTERRTNLFTTTMVMGIFVGHLWGATILSLAPSAFFIAPLIFALLLDNELLITPLVHLNRHHFFLALGALIAIVCPFLASFALGYYSVAVSLLSILHAALIFIHFQFVFANRKEKTTSNGEFQFWYIIGLFVLQILTTAAFGTNTHN